MLLFPLYAYPSAGLTRTGIDTRDDRTGHLPRLAAGGRERR